MAVFHRIITTSTVLCRRKICTQNTVNDLPTVVVRKASEQGDVVRVAVDVSLPPESLRTIFPRSGSGTRAASEAVIVDDISQPGPKLSSY